MKRFFCTVCNRVRRVRRLPHNTLGEPGAYSGSCRWHGAKSHHSALLVDRKPKQTVTVTRKVTPVAPKPRKHRGPTVVDEQVA